MDNEASYEELARSEDGRKLFFGLVLKLIADPNSGLPDEVFEFALAITPMINVDLLVSEDRGVLLAWRDDVWGRGWHVPGGIIRLNEPIDRRISEVARLELGTSVVTDLTPVALSQFFASRGHFISLMYRCTVSGKEPGPMAPNKAEAAPGELAWFDAPPSEIYPAHRDYISRLPEFETTDALGLAEPPITL